MDSNLNEFQTRKQKIDVLLREQGWDVSDRSQIVVEVDTKQSDFKSRSYRTVSETLRNDLESKYVDYLLLDTQGAPLAIIEAKRTTKDSLVGKKQAEQYADDIKRQTGKDVFILLSNGYEIWLWDRVRYGPRQIKGFYTQRDLERLRFQNEQANSSPLIEVNTSIVNRPRSIENVKRVLEHLQNGHRKALIVMATGTGKTRVAMGIIDALMKQNRAQKVLFLTDRIALRNQAWSKGLLEFFPQESKEKIIQGKYDKTKRLYVSTIQTFQEIYIQKDERGHYFISPGEFDLIISDEAHRSIYNKWRDVFTYLDAIQIGLTATPAELMDRDTFRFFGCDNGIPTAMYEYEDAVREGVLCDYRRHILGAQTHFQIEGIKPSDLSDQTREELIAKGIDPDDIVFEGTELEKKVAVKGTSEAIVREFMDNCQMDASGTLPAKTIFFAISKTHARRLWEAFERLYPQYKGQLAQIVVSEDSRASDLIHDFEHTSFPRVAISVDMLDTGIDVPEICNLVFAKPVFSKIKFWQMLGRGTRANSACNHQEWLPNGHKEYFMVFDFWNNFEYWSMNPNGEKDEQGEAITSRIFLLRLKQLELLLKTCDSRAEAVKKRVLDDVRSLPLESISVKEKQREIEKALSPKLWDNIAIDPLDYLKRNMMPLMKFKVNVNLKEESFIVKCERLSLATLQNDKAEIERLKTSIAEMVDRLPLAIDDVRAKQETIDIVTSKTFWNDIRFEDAQELIDELAPLMKYMSKEANPPIVIDMGDAIKQRKIWEWIEEEQGYVVKYREKVEQKIRELAESSSVVKKIKRGEAISEDDLRQLEEKLSELGVDITEERLQTKAKVSLVDLVRSVLGMSESEATGKRVDDAFQTYMIENNKQYNADQLNFIRTLQTVFSSKHHVEFNDLFEAPFSNFGAYSPIPMFEESDLKDFISLCGNLERELYT